MHWHQWQAAYPTEISRGTSRCLASCNASSPHGHQSTGLLVCWSRYGDRESASRFTRASSHHQRYEREQPGELLHVDVKKIGRIPDGGGWRAHGP